MISRTRPVPMAMPSFGNNKLATSAAAMPQPDIWYVAFEPKKPSKSDDSGSGAVRSTRTFKSEIDAKLFAMQILAKGWSASAGTLNPHQPRQIVAPSQIERWADPGLGG